MDAVKFLKEYYRLCNSYLHTNVSDTCTGCPLWTNRIPCSLDSYKCENVDKIVTVVEQWSKEHPVKTYKDDFLEKFPNAKTIDGELVIQWCRVYNKGECNYPSQKCVNCWHQALGE